MKARTICLTESYWSRDDSEPLLETTLGELLRTRAADSPERVAFVEGTQPNAERRRWTYGALLASAEYVARALLRRFSPGERVAVWSPSAAFIFTRCRRCCTQFSIAPSGRAAFSATSTPASPCNSCAVHVGCCAGRTNSPSSVSSNERALPGLMRCGRIAGAALDGFRVMTRPRSVALAFQTFRVARRTCVWRTSRV